MSRLKFINRESSWLDFNARVLEEARDQDNPLLERLKFIAITSNNLDEFFMVRMGSLHFLQSPGHSKKDPSGLTPSQQLKGATQKARKLVEEQYRCFKQEIEPAMIESGIVRVTPESANAEQKGQLLRLFKEELASILTPAAVNMDGTTPFYPNLALQLFIRLKDEIKGKKKTPRLAILPILGDIDRFISLRVENGYGYIPVEDVLTMHIQQFFPSDEVLEVVPFRITRNADMAVSEDGALDLVTQMDAVLSERKVSDCVRIELLDTATQVAERQLRKIFSISENEIYRVSGPLNFADYFSISGLPGYDHLRQEEWPPCPHPQLDLAKPLFDQIAAKPCLFHHPYDSFDPVVKLIEQAAEDPQVIAIKQILYRTSKNSPIVNALMRAAERGKTVTVIVELKARFDEARNIEWARAMEQAGVQVIYGVKGFKTHAKLLIIVRREPGGIRRYLHLGTGNYNEGTAKLYTDISYLTCDPDLGMDATMFFNTITGFSQPQSFQRLAAAPLTIRNSIYQMIEGEIERAKQGEKAQIRAKFNSLADTKMIEELYRASNAGVKIELLVRGICCLHPGIKGLSENIRVISIVDRFLEHSRIFWFYHGGAPRVFISSADWMTRNLDKRVELMTPVDEPALREELEHILNAGFKDNVKARELGADGVYTRLSPEKGEKAYRSQEVLYNESQARANTTSRSRRTTFEPHRPQKRKAKK
ncbi:polyphosphate kinase 1 [Kiritimatiellaeota bacterium B1221]|nr:polyphosphate kinase 1 [Kiritimatiellaeota bacterium B1221]